MKMMEFHENALKSSTLMEITDLRGLGLGNTLPTLQFNWYFRVGGGKSRNSWNFMKIHEFPILCKITQHHQIIFYVFSISVCASWGALRKPYINQTKYDASGGRDPPRGAIFVILAISIDLSGILVKLGKISSTS